MAYWRDTIDFAKLKAAPAGVIYSVVGKKYLDEAMQSATSVRKWMPRTPITMFCSEPVDSPLFDQCVRIDSPQGSFEDKIIAMRCSPYGRTLFLDSDTYLCNGVEELFELLDRYDLAAALDPYHHDQASRSILTPQTGRDLPAAVVEHNSGVISYRQSPAMAHFLDEWYALYVAGRSAGIPADQVTFRVALYHSDIRVATLPQEYNFRLPLTGLAFSRVSILHGRGNLESISQKINQSVNETRLSIPGLGILSRNNPLFRTLSMFRSVRRQFGKRRK